MKRLFGMLLILVLIYVSIQLGFKYFGTGHLVEYTIKNDAVTVSVTEKYVTNTKNERDNYYIQMNTGDEVFSFQTFLDFKKYDTIIKDVRYYKDDLYTCVYPIFKLHTTVSDVICKGSDSIIRYYHTIKGISSGLDQFVLNLKKEKLYEELWNDDTGKKLEALHVEVYDNNIVPKHYLGVDQYDGIYTVNNYSDNRHLFTISVFDKDFYDKPLSGQAGRYYVVADYSSTYDFTTFHTVDLMYNDRDTLRYHSKFSFDSYFQGSVGDSLFMFDPSTKKQYEINPKSKYIKEVGNEEIGVRFYNNGKMETRPVVAALNQKLLFNIYTSSDFNGYDRVDKVGNSLSGYYYLYKKVAHGYEVYRLDIQNREQLTYLFTLSSLSNISYIREYVYYKDGNFIKYYSDRTGVRTLMKDTEFEFNKGLKFYIYYHK